MTVYIGTAAIVLAMAAMAAMYVFADSLLGWSEAQVERMKKKARKARARKARKHGR